MCLAKGPQCSDAGEARTRRPSVSSQALYWATALPQKLLWTDSGIKEAPEGGPSIPYPFNYFEQYPISLK